MGVYYYIYAEIKNEQYVIGPGKPDFIHEWFSMFVHFKNPTFAAIVHENDYWEKAWYGEEAGIHLNFYANTVGLFKLVMKKKVTLGEETHFIDPYDRETDLFKMLSKYEEYQQEEMIKNQRRAKEDAEWNALSKEEQKRIQDEYIQEAIRLAKEGSDDE